MYKAYPHFSIRCLYNTLVYIIFIERRGVGSGEVFPSQQQLQAGYFSASTQLTTRNWRHRVALWVTSRRLGTMLVSWLHLSVNLYKVLIHSIICTRKTFGPIYGCLLISDCLVQVFVPIYTLWGSTLSTWKTISLIWWIALTISYDVCRNKSSLCLCQ